MVSATARATFSFPHNHHLLVQPKQTHTNSLLVVVLPSHHHHHHQQKKKKLTTLTLSIDVSKEDKPIQSDAVQEAAAAPQDEGELTPLDKKRMEEKFAVLNTGVYECRSCGYKYDEAVGDPSYPVPPGLPFDKLPENWGCSTCGAAKSFFQSKRVEIAGFEQNQQYGFGANTLTSGQKAVLIYGSLTAFFALFLSGYFIQ